MKNRSLKFIAVISTLVILSMILALSTYAAYPKHTDFISDKAVILDEKTEKNVIKASDKLAHEKKVRIAVCTVLDTEGESIQSYGSNLFKKWDIDDGVLILLSINDDNFYAVQSNSLSEYLPADDLKNILSTSLEPAFAAKDYSDGVQKTVYALSNHLSNSIPEDFGKDKSAGLPGWATAIIVIVVVLALMVGGGFGVIIFLRKKNARRRREEMELRRRRLAEGRGRELRQGTAQYQPRRPQGVNPAVQRGGNNNGVRPMGNPAINGQGRPMPTGAPRGQGRPSGNPRTPGNTPQTPGRTSPSNAATIQINTSDIRAAKQNRRP